MAFVPRRAGVFDALRNQVVRRNLRTGAVHRAVGGHGIGRIATRISRRRPVKRRGPRSRIELRQAIERNVRESIRPPVSPPLAEVMIQRSILLGHENNVIQYLYSLAEVESRRDRTGGIHRQLARASAAAGTRPSCEERSPVRRRLKRHDSSRSVRCAARWSTTDTCRSADYRSAGGPRQLHRQLISGGRSLRDSDRKQRQRQKGHQKTKILPIQEDPHIRKYGIPGEQQVLGWQGCSLGLSGNGAKMGLIRARPKVSTIGIPP